MTEFDPPLYGPSDETLDVLEPQDWLDRWADRIAEFFSTLWHGQFR